MDIQSIVAASVTVVLGISVVWKKASKALTAINEIADVLTCLTNALKDQKLTAEELTSLQKEIKESIAAIKAIIK